ncbi:MAG TPA: branched-chain amino acid ABC transporter permease [Candidatus Sulfotelmatobacter sp.]|nr:branched-chain amino acid ABC transporter permease [Candidatus Sulfotelmatobacter sp.]
MTVGSGYALVALGLHIILRATRVMNFAQGEFTVVGGLIALTLMQTFHATSVVALIGATICGFVLGLGFERFVLRPAARSGEMGVTIATVGTVFVLLYGHALVPTWGSLQQPLPPFTGRLSDAIVVAGATIQIQSLWIGALLLLALAALYVFFERTYYGKAIRAAANNPLGARLVGIDVTRARAISVGLSIALAAYGGTIIGPITLVGGAGGVAIAIKGFVGAIVGGLDSPIGCVAGGLLVGVVEKFLQSGLGASRAEPTVYALLLVMLLLRPQGLFGTRGAVRD